MEVFRIPSATAKAIKKLDSAATIAWLSSTVSTPSALSSFFASPLSSPKLDGDNLSLLAYIARRTDVSFLDALVDAFGLSVLPLGPHVADVFASEKTDLKRALSYLRSLCGHIVAKHRDAPKNDDDDEEQESGGEEECMAWRKLLYEAARAGAEADDLEMVYSTGVATSPPSFPQQVTDGFVSAANTLRWSRNGWDLLGACVGWGTVSSLVWAVDTFGLDVNRGKDEDYLEYLRPIHTAAARCDHAMLAALLEAGAFVKARTVNGFSCTPGNPLHIACGMGAKHSEADVHNTLHLLIQAGLDPNQPSVMDKRTPLYLALSRENRHAVVFLVVYAGVEPSSDGATNKSRRWLESAVEQRDGMEESSKRFKPLAAASSSGAGPSNQANEAPPQRLPDAWESDNDMSCMSHQMKYSASWGLVRDEDKLENGSLPPEVMEAVAKLGEAVEIVTCESESCEPWHAFAFDPARYSQSSDIVQALGDAIGASIASCQYVVSDFDGFAEIMTHPEAAYSDDEEDDDDDDDDIDDGSVFAAVRKTYAVFQEMTDAPLVSLDFEQVQPIVFPVIVMARLKGSGIVVGLHSQAVCT